MRVATAEMDHESSGRIIRHQLTIAIKALRAARVSAQKVDSCDEFVVRLTQAIDDIQKLKDVHLRERT